MFLQGPTEDSAFLPVAPAGGCLDYCVGGLFPSPQPAAAPEALPMQLGHYLSSLTGTGHVITQGPPGQPRMLSLSHRPLTPFQLHPRFSCTVRQHSRRLWGPGRGHLWEGASCLPWSLFAFSWGKYDAFYVSVKW